MKTHLFPLYRAMVAVMLGLTAFAVAGRDREYATDSIPDSWSVSLTCEQTLPSSDAWWKGFEDPVLEKLIAMGEDNNYNLSMAAKRIEIARNTLNSVRASYYPQVGLDAGWTKQRTGSAFDLGLSASWEIDLFGKVRSSAKSKDALYKASRVEYTGAMISLAGQIASAYIQLREYQAELALAEQHCTNQDHVVKITEARHEAGLGNALEVAQSKVVLYSTEATIPSLECAVAESINAIAVLVGVYPQEIRDMLMAETRLPQYHAMIQTGVPMELIRRRPDIIQAELQLESYAAEVGVAKKDFLPTLTLNGSIGTAARNAGDLFTSPSYTYEIAPTLSWNLFDGFARKNALASARQQMEIGIDNYNQTILTAVQETENALTGYSSALSEISKLESVVDESRKAMKLSLDLYKQGLAAFTNVYNAQIDLLQYENSLIQAKAKALSELVSLYVALGGGPN